jgi:hypothetical protein
MPVSRPSGNGITHYAVAVGEFPRDGNGSVTGYLNRAWPPRSCRGVSRPGAARTTCLSAMDAVAPGSRSTQPAAGHHAPHPMTDATAPAARQDEVRRHPHRPATDLGATRNRPNGPRL